MGFICICNTQHRWKHAPVLVATWMQPLNNEGDHTQYPCERFCTHLQRVCLYFLLPTSYLWHNKPSVEEEIYSRICHQTNVHIDITKVRFTDSTTQHRPATVRNRSTRPVQPLPTSFVVQQQNIDVPSSISIFPQCWRRRRLCGLRLRYFQLNMSM